MSRERARYRLDWNDDGSDWPHRAHSRFVEAGGLRWHVQVMGPTPAGSSPEQEAMDCLLLHGTGASSHSFAGLMPLLAEGMRVITPDLPGHAFTESPSFSRLSLPAMAEGLHALLTALDASPALVVGHSAGAAIALRMALDGRISPRAIVSLNGALVPFKGLAGQIFAPVAKLVALWPIVPTLFAWRASDPAVIDQLLKQTGSRLPARMRALYARLATSPGHAGAAFDMMANWDLAGLMRDLPRLAVPLTLIAGAQDGMVPPTDAAEIAAVVPAARIVKLAGLGHLAHEERPDLIAPHILAALASDPAAAASSSVALPLAG